MSLRRLLPLLALAALVLTACAPTRSVYPPAISVQALQVLKDGRWQVTVRFDNYAYRALRFDTLDAELSIGGVPAGRLSGPIGIAIPELSGDVARFTLAPAAAAAAALNACASPGATGAPAGAGAAHPLTGCANGSVAYALAGTVVAGLPDARQPEHYATRHAGYLSPVPGLPDAWR
ncbi:MAG: hypothetical protein KGI40_04130 [Xanthomonadaceae bacterium]|nr:hypothetical protein [Xanthomonadaceae bacterium]MDE2176982.1 hypothetical protein [Xanthomonadaceae bacterium]